MIKVLIADDHPVVRGALRDLFDDTEDIRVVGECVDGSEVLEASGRTDPDVVLMDMVMPRMTGLEATRELLAACPSARVVVLTGSFSPASAAAAHVLGAVGYLIKGDNPGDLVGHVRSVAAGGTAWSPVAAASIRQLQPR